MYYNKLIKHLEEELINVMRYRLYSKSSGEYIRFSALIKDICDVLEELYSLDTVFKKGIK